MSLVCGWTRPRLLLTNQSADSVRFHSRFGLQQLCLKTYPGRKDIWLKSRSSQRCHAYADDHVDSADLCQKSPGARVFLCKLSLTARKVHEVFCVLRRRRRLCGAGDAHEWPGSIVARRISGNDYGGDRKVGSHRTLDAMRWQCA